MGRDLGDHNPGTPFPNRHPPRRGSIGASGPNLGWMGVWDGKEGAEGVFNFPDGEKE